MKVNLPPSLAREAQKRWQEFVRSADAQIPNFDPSLPLLSELPHLFAFSDFMARCCSRNPAWPLDLIAGGISNTPFRPAPGAGSSNPIWRRWTTRSRGPIWPAACPSCSRCCAASATAKW
jgi:hypothetical protein